MSTIMRVKIRNAYQQIKTAEHLFEQGLTALSTALKTIGECEDIALDDSLGNLPTCSTPVTDHRRAHRMGRVPKIERDPELQAFILARVDRLTFTQLAKEVAEHFPSERQVKKSAIHQWWSRQNS